jgi:glutathione S-transferase
MTYVLHYAPDNASLIVRLALEYRGLRYHAKLVDRAVQGQRAPAYLALNPNGLIPVLETPHGPLFETGAILLWLGDTHGRLGPMPTDAARGDYLKWLFFTANTLHPALRMMFYPEKFIATGHAALRAGLHQQINAALRQLDTVAAAAARPVWLGAAQPSALDFYVAACLRWCALYPAGSARDWFDLSAFPALLAMCVQLERLDCVRALQTAEGLGDTPFSAPHYPKPPEGSAT